MKKELRKLHIEAGRICGSKNTCDGKVNYKGEERASTIAASLSEKREKAMEAYPCAFCGGWHIGRAMTVEETTSIISNTATCNINWIDWETSTVKPDSVGDIALMIMEYKPTGERWMLRGNIEVRAPWNYKMIAWLPYPEIPERYQLDGA